MKRTYDMPDTEPEETNNNNLPSEKSHILQVVEVFTCEDEIGQKLNLDKNTISVKCKVAEGDETGRSLLHRLTLDENNQGFFATRLFLKAIGMPHKGKEISVDTDMWIGEKFSAFVVHNRAKNGKVYANIDTYSLEGHAPLDISKLEPVKNVEVAWDENL